MIKLKRQLNEAGVMGVNRRNAEYTLRYNSRDCYPQVDDKLQTKKLALTAAIAVPELYGVLETEYEVRNFARKYLGEKDSKAFLNQFEELHEKYGK